MKKVYLIIVSLLCIKNFDDFYISNEITLCKNEYRDFGSEKLYVSTYKTLLNKLTSALKDG